ncbi:flagellar basal-body MS-ring/collar protein FliF [Acidovorax sp. Leaf78]|uniref:flagellar basal-body MS-ring/collar protein FliF n=1 Tax=unclassified Acidovorax TaxID=2684926 RepID=UPI0006F695EA|nr:flagellar basal-body MS-ring/collar protein FliF [Acidovorax sp. Leaf78]KQO15659.1 flagellar M-ring protein FliF [Acidovorax sp. Leaf78]RZJ56476.1 MAG: flagellar basal body M-ring protein FliF [Acidovorax sp.]
MSAVAEIPLNSPASPNLLQRLSTLDRAKRMRLGVGVALLVVAAIAAIVLGRQPDYRVLFANLSDKDGGAIVAQLSQMNVPYKYADGGGAILIPSDRVHDVRLRLATQGLPKGSVTGFELMESSKFGMTQFQERLNFQRGLEGELTRSIQALSSVQGARVHLALPNQNGFFREQQKPSASVLVSLHPGRILDRAQLAGIVHLVASSVPELSPSAVSVLDDTGKLLSQSPDGGTGTEVNAQHLLHVQQLEQQYTRRIMDILEPVVGRNNVKAQVTAEVDFTQTESTSEQFRPNQTPDSTAIRSQQVLESKGSANKTATGVPGAVSNQPPAPTTAPVNGANPAPTAGNSQQGTEEQTSKRESTTNFEVDKTVRVTRGSTGNVKRLSAAVVVNYQTGEDKGKPITKALTPEQLEQMTALVRETIGFNKERGDSVNLMNTPFQVDATPSNDVPLWKQPEVMDLAKTFAWPVGAVLFAALVLLGLVRPALKGGASAKPQPVTAAGAQLDALESETPERAALPAPNKKDEVLPATPEQLRLDDARVLAKENPVAVANILKSWLNGDPA